MSSETETTVVVEYALWYKRARDLFNRRKSHPQPTACTPPSRPSSAWPRSSSRTTSHRHIKHAPTFVHNHAAPRGLGQLKNERAEGERDTLRSNHVATRITSPTPTTPSSACPSCPCLCYYRPRAVLCSCSCSCRSCLCSCHLVLVPVPSCARARVLVCSVPSVRWLAASVAGCFGGWPLRWLTASVAGRFGFGGWLLVCVCCACAVLVHVPSFACAARACACAGVPALAKAAVSFEAAAVVETAAFAAINSRIFDRHWGASSSGAARAGGGGLSCFFCSIKGACFFLFHKGARSRRYKRG